MASSYSATSEGEVALVAATAKRVLWVMGVTTIKPRLIEWGVSFDSTSGTAEPVIVKIFRCTSAGTTNSNSATVKKWDPDNPTANTLPFKTGWTTEPTRESQEMVAYEVHPQGGLVMQYPLGRELVIDNVTTDGFTIECTAPANVNVLPYFVWEE